LAASPDGPEPETTVRFRNRCCYFAPRARPARRRSPVALGQLTCFQTWVSAAGTPTATGPTIVPASRKAASPDGPEPVPPYPENSVAKTSPPWFVKNVRLPVRPYSSGHAYRHHVVSERLASTSPGVNPVTGSPTGRPCASARYTRNR